MPEPVNVITFPGTPNLPLFVAEEQGFFGDAVRFAFHTTPSSTYQIERLVAGEFQIAGTAVDNVIAYQGRRRGGRFECRS